MPDVAPDQITGLLRLAKEYWFLITLGLSLLATVFYMMVYRVNPWDKYREVKYRRDRIRFHNEIGYIMLERGHHNLAKSEFTSALNLKATDYEALNGHYFAVLFNQLESLEWDPSIGLAMQNHLTDLGIVRKKNLMHIVNKYEADVHFHIGDRKTALKYLDTALKLKPDYVDALFRGGWMAYDHLDFEKMIEMFDKMVEVDPFDYRGFHGLGYALYIKGVENHKDSDEARDSVYRASLQSGKAKDLKFNAINIVADFGEIARTNDPNLALLYHESALRMLSNREIREMPENRRGFVGKLLTKRETIYVETMENLAAWLKYQLALDHLAVHRRNSDKGNTARDRHDTLLKEAKKIDPKEAIYPIYEDQLEILNRLLPQPVDVSSTLTP